MKRSFISNIVISSWFFSLVSILVLLHQDRPLFAAQAEPEPTAAQTTTSPAAANITAQLSNITQIPDVNQQIATIRSAVQQAASAPADPAVQQAISQSVTQVYHHCPYEATRAPLAALLAQIKASPALTSQAQSQIQNVMLPGLAVDQAANQTMQTQPASQQQDITQQLFNLKMLPDYNQQVDTLESLMDQATAQQAAGGTIDPTTQQLLNQRVKDLAIAAPTDTASLDNLNELLQKAQNNPLIDPTTQSLIQTQFIPQTNTDLTNASAQEQMLGGTPIETQPSPQIQQSLDNIAQIADPNEKIAAFGSLVQDATTQPLNLASQQLLASGLHDLYETTPLDPAALANLNAVAAQAQASPAFDQIGKNYIQTTLLPSLAQEQPSAQFGQDLNTAMAQPTTTARIASVSALTDKYASAQIPANAQNFYAQALQTLFDERYATQVVVSKKSKQAATGKAANKKKTHKTKKHSAGKTTTPQSQTSLQKKHTGKKTHLKKKKHKGGKKQKNKTGVQQ